LGESGNLIGRVIRGDRTRSFRAAFFHVKKEKLGGWDRTERGRREMPRKERREGKAKGPSPLSLNSSMPKRIGKHRVALRNGIRTDRMPRARKKGRGGGGGEPSTLLGPPP